MKLLMHRVVFCIFLVFVINRTQAQENIMPVKIAEIKPVTLHLQFIAFADSDGSHSKAFNASVGYNHVAVLNRAFAKANVQFVWDAHQDYIFVRNTIFNRNFDYNYDESRMTDSSRRPSQAGWREHDEARRKLLKTYPGKVVCFFAAGSRWEYHKDQGRWTYEEAGPSWGTKLVDLFLAGDGGAIVHEMGHFLGLPHTYKDGDVTTPEEFTKRVQTYIDSGHPIQEGLNAFDNDITEGIQDTPPDPGAAFWQTVKTDVIRVSVVLADGRKYTYTVSKDTKNPMASSSDAKQYEFSMDQCRIIHDYAKRVGISKL